MYNFLKNKTFKTFKPKKRKNADTVTSHNYFHGHDCHVPPEKLTSYEVKCGKWRKALLGLTSVNTGDIRALNMYRSYAALCAEKYRHYKLYSATIHPFSKLRFILEIIFSMAIFFCGVLLASLYSEKDPSHCETHKVMMTVCDLVQIANIITNFFTGYISGKSEKFAVLNLKKIAYRYAKTWLFIDVLASIRFIIDLLNVDDIIPNLICSSVKILRLPILLVYMNNILTGLRASIYVKIGMEIFVLLTSFIAWNIYFQFSVEYVIEGAYMPTSPRNCSWMSVANLWDQEGHMRLIYSFDRAVGMLRKNTNINLLRKAGCFKQFYIIFWLIAKLLVVHCVLRYIIASFGKESARAKYHNMIKQAELYMMHRKLPPRIKNKVLKFYALRFQSHYFAEARMHACSTGQLHGDLLMHTGRQLVRELEFLKLLPRPLLMQIAFKLSIVIYFAGDIIIKINSEGDCMYFIDKGTVAIYSESGKEICHLEDGDFFGEIALVMQHRVRTASVVAVTNCELFRLDKEDFDTTIACYPTVYEDIKKLATSRFERTCVLDDHHKTEIKMANESQ